jgi:segregation and condensation protein B
MADSMDELPSPEADGLSSANGFVRDPDLIGIPSSEDLTTDDLEAAYLRAMEAIDTEEWAFDPELEFDSTEPNESSDSLDQPSDIPTDLANGLGTIDAGQSLSPDSNDVAPTESSSTDNQATSSAEMLRISSHTAFDEVEIAGSDFLAPNEPKSSQVGIPSVAGGPRVQAGLAGPSTHPSAVETSTRGSTRATDAMLPAPNATRIIEACLFVGGQPLSAKRLATLLESTSDPSHLEQLVDELNLEYASQQRPYEIRLGDGGYRMALRTEFEAVRNRVYGVGPRDVKLSQDVLEVLALVAYQQPIAHSAVEACGKANVANILRQLLRRELINLTRIDQTRMGVEYRTSPRFLQVFGLGNLNELPRPEDLAMR